MHSCATCVFETLSHKGAVDEGTCEFLAVRRALAVQKYTYVCLSCLLLLFKLGASMEKTLDIKKSAMNNYQSMLKCLQSLLPDIMWNVFLVGNCLRYFLQSFSS